jgi:DDE superfamily endonuclease
VLSAGDEHVGVGEVLVGGLDRKAAIERDLARAQTEAFELGRGLRQQLALVRGADLAGGRQNQPARTATRVGRELGELEDVAELVALAELALADRARVRVGEREPVRFSLFAVVDDEQDAEAVREWLALCYLAAWDVHRGQLTGRCESQTGIAPFGRLVEQVMTAEPYARARRVFWIVDNGSSHRGQPSIDRLEGQWPNLVLVQLPFYASWLNQLELVFSVIQRQVLTPNDFTSLQAVVDRLDAFEHHYNQIAKPFEWTFTRRDLTDLIARVADHEPRLTLTA